ncbi:MAG: hypothetical protein ACOH2H_00285 [Cypionkella sp.]
MSTDRSTSVPANRDRAAALDKGSEIPALLAEEPEGLNRAAIIKAMGRDPSETYRLVARAHPDPTLRQAYEAVDSLPSRADRSCRNRARGGGKTTWARCTIPTFL